MSVGILRSVQPACTAVEDPALVNRCVLVLTNAEGERYGVPPLQRCLKLEALAAFRSRDMATCGLFAHQDSEGRSSQGRLELLLPELIAGVGEIIAIVPKAPDEELARTLVKRWMESPGHRKNILDTTYSHLGVGLSLSSRQVFATQLFAALYAELLAQKPPLAVDPGAAVPCSSLSRSVPQGRLVDTRQVPRPRREGISQERRLRQRSVPP